MPILNNIFFTCFFLCLLQIWDIMREYCWATLPASKLPPRKLSFINPTDPEVLVSDQCSGDGDNNIEAVVENENIISDIL